LADRERIVPDRRPRPARRWLGWLGGVALLIWSTAAAAAACDAPPGFEPHRRIEGDDVVVLFRALPPPVEIGRPFSLEAIVCVGSGPSPQALRIDAFMPRHRHGMNYRARVSPSADGRYLAEGLLFHMPGHWRLVFDVDHDGRTERLTADVMAE
jgi:hypothetical protein